MTIKNLIVYYSFEGSSRLIAENIAKVLDADVLECKTVKNLKSKGFSKYFWGGRQVLFKKKPDLEKFEKNPINYYFIVIGTPVWSYNYSPAIRSFLSLIRLKDKKIALFCCHEGGIGKTLDNLKSELSENKIIDEMDFKNVAKNKEENILKAKKWAQSLVDKINMK